ncbi:hypothetical protein EJF36_06580 [Bacillus sp. HMF5848]|uniref:hypothetical protein n=1 Tax=Bacillus sp. HMF5848 TaxID=2495421 RepID=UPI000F7BAE56|nr:hypothetical protein [Bacillus sp. HMF5848]RSK26551.1 hypothetical protein EJF36_06580 [Bacillus sp. HMF5848]
MERALLTQFFFSCPVELSLSSKSNPAQSFTYNKITFENETTILSRLLENLNTPCYEVVCWLLIDESITRRDIFKIETYFEKQLTNLIGDEWEFDVKLVPYNHVYSMENYLLTIEPHLHDLSRRYTDEIFAQVIVNSHLLPFQAIFLEGLRQFENRYASLYVSDKNSHVTIITHHAEPNMKDWFTQFDLLILDFDYKAAFELLKDLPDDRPIIKALENVLLMMIQRLNFSFENAYKYVVECEKYLTNGKEAIIETKHILKNLLSKDEKVRDLERIIELYRHIEMYVTIDDVPSFLVRFYRVREAVLFYLLRYARTSNEISAHVGKKSSIYQVFEHLEELYDNWEIDGHYGAYFYLKSQNVANILNVRNKSFLGHSRAGIQPKQLWHSYVGYSQTTMAKAKKRYLMDIDLALRDLGAQLDDNVYSINMLIIELAKQLKKSGEMNETFTP